MRRGMGQDIYEGRWRLGKAYMQLKSNEQGEFDKFCKRGSVLYETVRRGGEHYLKPKNDVPYHVFGFLYVGYSVL